ncbi:MAG: M23 family metallopeptidase, partial [Mucinivorans sp.]
YRDSRRVLLFLLAALVANFAFSYFFYTPKMWRLRAEASTTVAQYELLQKRVAIMSEELLLIKERDRGVYRSIFSQDTLSTPTRYFEPSFNESYGRYAALIQNTESQVEELARKLYHASLSLDDMETLAKNKDAMAERVPAIWPIDRRALRGHIGAFGSRVHPISRRIRFHEGVDFAGPVGTPVVATGAGVVSRDKITGGYGLQVLIDHGIGYKTRYGHLSKILVTMGQSVVRGQVIGLMGSTGRSTGSHLHYEVIHRGRPVNPVSYFSRDMTSAEFQEIINSARQITYEIEE